MAKTDYIGDIQAKYNAALENQREKFDKFNDYEYIFHSKLKKYDPNIPSKVFNPIVWSFIETIVTRMLAKKPTVTFKPREMSDEVQGELWSSLFDYWLSKAGAIQKLNEMVKQALIYGTAIIKVGWRTAKPRKVNSYVTDPMTGEAVVDPMTGQFATEVTEVVDYDDPYIENVNIYDFFFDPAANDIDTAEWVIYQYKTTIDALNEVPHYDKKAIKKLITTNNPSNEQYEEARRQAAGYTNLPKTKEGEILIWEYTEDDKVCVVANGDTILYEGANPFWHGKKGFIRYVDSLNPLDFYGKGEIEPVEKMIHALNTLINQRITNTSQILNPPWLAKPNVDDSELQFVPNSIIHVNDLQDVKMMEQRDVTASSFQEQQIIVETIQRTLGVTDYVQGVQTPGQTAAEVEVKTSQANARFAYKLQMFEDMVIRELGEMVYKLYQQFITTEKIIRILGEEGEELIRLTPKDLSGMFDVIPEPGSTLEIDEEKDAQKFLTLYQLMQGKPYIKQDEMDKKAFKELGEQDPDKYFYTEEEMYAQQQQQLADAAGAISSAIGGGQAEAVGQAQAGQRLV